MSKQQIINWADEVDPDDFDHVKGYLSLKLAPTTIAAIVKELMSGKIVKRRAHDILRAAGYMPLPLADPGVVRQICKIAAGKQLSPVLIVQYASGRCDIGDGMHRASLAYWLNPGEPVSCVIAEIGGAISETEPTTNY